MSARDPGLQPERTALSSQRTGLAATAACLLAGVAALRHDAPWLTLVAALLVPVPLAVLLRPGLPAPSRLAGLAAVASGTGVLGVAIAVLALTKALG